MTDAPTHEPLLRTLAPLLHTLERDVRGWLDGAHRKPLPLIARASLEGMVNDLRRQAEALDVDRPLLVVMLMGGTGVGKSTLLNALAGGAVAQASFTRPTTRDPVVYYHESVKPDRLDPALRHCRLAPHDRPALVQKILVDTPDLDSNDIVNREKLKALLPVADVVLYVGSQEKYHDQLGWELFKEQRKRRAFAFVLNKWDRCLQPGASGLRPDEDLLRDLKDEGFETPLLYRTMAQSWLDAAGNGVPAGLPDGEQFAELRTWLEAGLTRLEIEAVKARGVGQLLGQLDAALKQVKPDDLSAEATRTRQAWELLLLEEAAASGDVLVSTLEPYATEIEHHFRVEGQQKFRGLMAAYLKMTTRIRYAGTSLRDRLPFVPTMAQKVETPASWNLAAFAHECTRVAGEKVLNQRAGALVNRLLVEADRQRFSPGLLNAPTNEAARTDWQARYDRALIEALAEVERSILRPRGVRRVVHSTVVTLANYLPELVFVAAFLILLWRYFVLQQPVELVHVVIPFALTLVVLILMHLLSAVLLPMRWSAVKGEFLKQLVTRLDGELTAVYTPIPALTAEALLLERARIEELLTEVREVRTWLDERQSAASVAGLYGD
ncbi:MAG TPA: GTPase [Gemmataceae bacterium]|nr:GTPase [Gemmataceae bacterium]